MAMSSGRRGARDPFKPGRRVRVTSVDKRVLEDSGCRYAPIMEKYMNRVGIIHRCAASLKDCWRVSFYHVAEDLLALLKRVAEPLPERPDEPRTVKCKWSFPASTLRIYDTATFLPGDRVVIIEDKTRLKRLNTQFDNVEQYAGHLGQIRDIIRGEISLLFASQTEITLSAASLLPVYEACPSANSPVFRPITLRGQTPSSTSQEASPAYESALTERDWPTVLRLSRDKNLVNSAARDGKPALIVAIEQNETDVVRRLLLLGADPCCTEKTGLFNTPLHSVANSDNNDLLKVLLPNASNVNVPNGNSETALHLALQRNSHHCAQTLLAHPHINPNAVAMRNGHGTGNTLIHSACDQPYLLGLVLQHAKLHRRIVYEPDNRGQLPIHCAVHTNNIESIGLLLDFEADLAAAATTTDDKVLPLHLAVEIADFSVVRKIAQVMHHRGLSMDLPDGVGQSALHRLPKRTFGDQQPSATLVDVCVGLNNNGANLNLKDREGNTALIIAGSELKRQLQETEGLTSDEIITLQSLPTDTQVVDLQVELSLQFGSRLPCLSLVCALLAIGADPSAQNNAGDSFESLMPPSLRFVWTAFSALHKGGARSFEGAAACADDEDFKLKALQERIQELEDQVKCGICMETDVNMVVFKPCGHQMCHQCSKKIVGQCSFCKILIKERIKTYR